MQACAKAYEPPWTVPPGWAAQLVATLVAYDVALWLRLPERYPIEALRVAYDEAQGFIRTRLDVGGEPYGDGAGPIDAVPTVAAMGAVALTLKGRGFLGHYERSDEV